jgi:hypothetical protein
MRRLVIASICVLSMLPGSARATVLVSMDFPELAASADAIVHGRVVSVQARWMDGRRRIESLVTIEVAEYLRGDFGSPLTIRVPGGDFGGYRSVFVGAPTFSEGDEVILFLGARGPSLPFVVGLNQGVFRVLTPPGFQTKVVTPSVPVYSDTVGAFERRRLSPDAFAKYVRRTLASSPGATSRRPR